MHEKDEMLEAHAWRVVMTLKTEGCSHRSVAAVALSKGLAEEMAAARTRKVRSAVEFVPGVQMTLVTERATPDDYYAWNCGTEHADISILGDSIMIYGEEC
jgi:hypothetical protein